MKKILLSTVLTVLIACSPAKKTIETTTTEVINDFEKTAKLYERFIAGEPNKTMLNLFFTQMPKGGDLHHHYTGTIYAETYLDWVKAKGWFINSCSLKIEQEAGNTEGCKSLTVDELMKNDALYRELLTLWSDKDFDNHYHNQPAPDQNFFYTFGYFGPVSNEYMQDGLQILKERAIAENVSYIETMLTRVGLKYSKIVNSTVSDVLIAQLEGAKSQKEVDLILDRIDNIYLKNDYFNTGVTSFIQMVDKLHSGMDDANFTMRYQTYGVRTLNPLHVYTDLLSGYLAAEGSNYIVGVNIVAPENNQIALDNYTLHMQMYNHLLRKYPDVNRALHAGELTLGMVRPKDLLFHIDEAIDIAKAQRIGHGIDLPYESEPIQLLSKLKEQAAIEINLTSNQFILGVEGKEHPYLIYSQYGVPLVISTDDSGVSRNNLTNEYVLLASRYQPSYAKIKEYVYNSIRYSFLSSALKDKMKQNLDKRFEVFEAEMASSGL